MKIDGLQCPAPAPEPESPAGRPATSRPPDNLPAADAVSVSTESRLLAKGREVIYQAPESRPEKVARLKEAVDAGTYTVDTRQVANRLIAQALVEKPRSREE